MKKGIKKAITSPAKETVITDDKRPFQSFCCTHFNMKDENNQKVKLTVGQVRYINSLFDQPLFIIDDENLTFRPVDENRFTEWLNEIKRGDR